MLNKSRQGTFSAVVQFFIITFAFTWLFWLIAILSANRLIPAPFPVLVWVIIGAHGPLFASLWLECREGGRAAAVKLIRSGFRLNMKFKWWLVIIIFPFILAGLAFWINVTYSTFEPDTSLLAQPLLLIPNFLLMFFLLGSLQEEFGWRGYALPRMLSVQSPFWASLILGVIWGLWHLPLFFIPGIGQAFMNFGIFFILNLNLSFLFTWFYKKTDFNLFSALLLHAAINSSTNLFPPIEQVPGGNQAAFTYLAGFYLLCTLVIVIRHRRYWFTGKQSADG
jgi:uncharacterized protein